MQLALLGDSLLAEVGRDRTHEIEARLPGCVVLNCATSGFTVAHLLRQVEHLARVRPSVIVVSIGTNDAAPDRAIDVDDFERDLALVLDAFPDSRRLVFLPPGVDESRRDPSDGRANEQIDRFREAAIRAAGSTGSGTVDGPALAAAVIARGEDSFVADGIHLTDAMYAELAADLERLLR